MPKLESAQGSFLEIGKGRSPDYGRVPHPETRRGLARYAAQPQTLDWGWAVNGPTRPQAPQTTYHPASQRKTPAVPIHPARPRDPGARPAVSAQDLEDLHPTSKVLQVLVECMAPTELPDRGTDRGTQRNPRLCTPRGATKLLPIHCRSMHRHPTCATTPLTVVHTTASSPPARPLCPTTSRCGVLPRPTTARLLTYSPYLASDQRTRPQDE